MIPVIAYSTKNFPWIEVFAESVRRSGLNLIQINGSFGTQSEKRRRFAANYRHLSPNPVAFELACFDRYFAVAEYASNEGYDSFFMSDTDILVNDSAGKELTHLAEGVDVMLSRPQRAYEGYSRYVEYSPHFSFWTKEAVNDFIDFFVNAYCTDEGRNLVDQAYRSNQAITKTGVSDMTLCHLWLNARKPRFRNSVSIDKSFAIDHNISLSDHARPNQFRMRNGIKSLKLIDSKLYFEGGNDELSYPLVMHFQGKYKIIMRDVLAKNLTLGYAKAALVSGLRRARARLSGY